MGNFNDGVQVITTSDEDCSKTTETLMFVENEVTSAAPTTVTSVRLGPRPEVPVRLFMFSIVLILALGNSSMVSLFLLLD